MWAIAFALNSSIAELAKNNKTLEQFNYKDNYISSVIKQTLADVDFYGVTVSKD